jgi:hypothetical protein
MDPQKPGRRQGIASLRGHERGITRMSILIVAAVGVAGCAARSSQQEQALRGVGTPGVSSYATGDKATSLQALLESCRQAPEQAGPPSGTRDLGAACSQLHRTMHSQPGNTAGPGTVP